MLIKTPKKYIKNTPTRILKIENRGFHVQDRVIEERIVYRDIRKAIYIHKNALCAYAGVATSAKAGPL